MSHFKGQSSFIDFFISKIKGGLIMDIIKNIWESFGSLLEKVAI
jgi:hypothetical protein